MVQGYYSLDEAARILGMAAEELSQMAQKREVRAFADRGTWRFRTQDIQELARQRGMGSNPDLPLGEAPPVKGAEGSPPRAKTMTGDALNFGLGSESDVVEIGQEIIVDSPSGSRKVGSKSGSRNVAKSPSPRPGSDSDVRLVADGSDLGFKISESDVKLDDSGPKSGSKKRGKQDSGVRLVPMHPHTDSDVKIVTDSSGEIDVLGGQPPKSGTDSDVRLESGKPGSSVRLGGKPDDSFLTEEIDLDAELRKAEGQAKPKSDSKRPATAPFELSETDLTVPHKPAGAKLDSSSDIDMKIDSGSSIELDSADPSVKDEEVSLGEIPARGVTGASDSGINLQQPADSGISLEQTGDSSEEIEFELSLDAESTPKPSKAKPQGVDSSSEFELTLEDSAKLAPEDVAAASGEQKDIFETDFEVPALDDESGSQVVAIDGSDTDLESSDFDLALGEDDMVAEEESGSQVVALEDEEEVDEGAATVARPRKRGAVAEEEAADFVEEEAEAEPLVSGARRTVVPAVAVEDWGKFTPITLCVSVLILFFVGMMSFELVHSMWGYHTPNKASGLFVRGLSNMLGSELPAD